MTVHTPGGEVWIRHPSLPRSVIIGLFALYTIILLAAFIHHVWMIAQGRQNVLPRALLFLSVTIAFAAAALIQEIIVAIAVVTAFHNLQYIGLVWFHNRTRAERGAVEGNRSIDWIANRKTALYVVVSMIYGVFIIGPIALFPTAVWAQIPITLVVALHYYVDGRAWRFKEVPERALYLKLRS
jgi:hypothetical protein